MLTPEHRVLLMEVQEPSSGFRIWVTPGGGMEPGEDAETCLRREILEETNLVQVNIGPLIWHRHHTFEWDHQMLSQDEDYYFVPIAPFEPNILRNPSEVEMKAFRQFKWWTPQEISASQDLFVPRLLSEHLESLILDGPPSHPIEVGI